MWQPMPPACQSEPRRSSWPRAPSVVSPAQTTFALPVVWRTIPWAQTTSKSGPLAKQLVAALEAAKMDSIAAKDPAGPDVYVGALYISGFQLLVVSGSYAAPTLLDARISKKEYRDTYLDLTGASTPATRIMIEDLGADGLKAKREDDAPFDAGVQYRHIYGLWFLGRIAEADRVASRGMEMWPGHPGIWFGRFWVLADTRRFDRAIAHIDDAASRPPLPPPMVQSLRAAISATASGRPAEIENATRMVMAGAARSVAGVVNAMMLLNLMKSVDAAYAAAMSKLPTPRLTRALQQAVERQQPPRAGVVRPKLRYAHQGGSNPPIIVIHGSALDRVPDAYRRYLERFFAEAFQLRGTPLRIQFKSGVNPYARS